jgi:ADP-heptose:LPS heptosyltransferase
VLSIRAPDHLGDGVMALPAVAALARALGARVHAPRWGEALYGGLAGVVVVPREAPPAAGSHGVLLKPSFGAAWRWRHLPSRTGLATQGRGLLLSRALPVMPGEPRWRGWARVAESLGAVVEGPPRWPHADAPDDAGAAAGLPPVGFVALHVHGKTPVTRWPHARRLADLLRDEGHAPWFLAGPAEHDAVAAVAGAHPILDHDDLHVLVAQLRRAAVVVGHDSGVTHLAAAAGVPTVMLHGPTDAMETGAGDTVRTGLGCSPCVRRRCVRAPWSDTRAPCMEHLSVTTVRAALDPHLRRVPS